jgi:hypothetical protein
MAKAKPKTKAASNRGCKAGCKPAKKAKARK